MGGMFSIACGAALFLFLVAIFSSSYRHAIASSIDASADRLNLKPNSGSSEESATTLTEVLGCILDEFTPAKSEHKLKTEGISPEKWPGKEQSELMDLLDVTIKDALHMRQAHTGFLKAVDEKLPKYVAAKGAKPRGIVTVGGAGYFPPLMVSLRLLRRTGTTLPVEIFLPASEYEEELCQKVLPTLNAVCRTFPTPSRNSDINISHYQFKIFAILLSSFKEVLWLDADNFPLRDVAPLFSSEPFQQTGLVTWPDLWQTSVSPAYYLVSSQEPVDIVQRASTESGQLLVSKQKHWKTLLLTAYYNYYGPGHYYSLLCQNGAGCGDKETFIPAAEALGLPFYDVKTPTVGVGHKKGELATRIYTFALIQHDAAEDYAISKKLARPSGTPLEKLSTFNATSNAAYTKVRPMFLHMSVPKWDAYHVFDHAGPYDLTRDMKRHRAPAFRDMPDVVETKLKGVERMVWEELRWVGCNLENTLAYWEKKRGHICKNLDKYFKEVLNTQEGADMGLGSKDALMPPKDSSSQR
jgi:alpha 1,2-mannosyltransferase